MTSTANSASSSASDEGPFEYMCDAKTFVEYALEEMQLPFRIRWDGKTLYRIQDIKTAFEDLMYNESMWRDFISETIDRGVTVTREESGEPVIKLNKRFLGFQRSVEAKSVAGEGKLAATDEDSIADKTDSMDTTPNCIAANGKCACKGCNDETVSIASSPESPPYEPESPRYEPESPRYEPESPRYEPESPRYCSENSASLRSPNYQWSPKSPMYCESPKSPRYCESPKSPMYETVQTNNSTVTSLQSPLYKEESTMSSPQSPIYEVLRPMSPPQSPMYGTHDYSRCEQSSSMAPASLPVDDSLNLDNSSVRLPECPSNPKCEASSATTAAELESLSAPLSFSGLFSHSTDPVLGSTSAPAPISTTRMPTEAVSTVKVPATQDNSTDTWSGNWVLPQFRQSAQYPEDSSDSSSQEDYVTSSSEGDSSDTSTDSHNCALESTGFCFRFPETRGTVTRSPRETKPQLPAVKYEHGQLVQRTTRTRSQRFDPIKQELEYTYRFRMTPNTPEYAQQIKAIHELAKTELVVHQKGNQYSIVRGHYTNAVRSEHCDWDVIYRVRCHEPRKLWSFIRLNFPALFSGVQNVNRVGNRFELESVSDAPDSEPERLSVSSLFNQTLLLAIQTALYALVVKKQYQPLTSCANVSSAPLKAIKAASN